MRYIEIAEGLSICRDKIDSISVGEDNTSIVKIGQVGYVSTFPYGVLLQLLETDNGLQKEKREEEALNIFKQIGTPAW